MSEKTKIYHIMEIKTRKVVVSSMDEKKLEKVYLERYNSKHDFIYSYDGEDIFRKPQDGCWINGKEVSPEEFIKQIKELKDKGLWT